MEKTVIKRHYEIDLEDGLLDLYEMRSKGDGVTPKQLIEEDLKDLNQSRFEGMTGKEVMEWLNLKETLED